MASFEDALQETMSDRASLVEKVGELTATNEQFQHSTKELIRQLNVERQRNKLEQTLKIDKQKWQQETNLLLTSIQEHCNDVFRSKIRELQKNESSPRTVLMSEELNHQNGFYPTFSTGLTNFFDIPDTACSGTVQSTGDVHQVHTPLHVNKTLDETEAILQNLLGADVIL
jgi:membrane-associated HD superfamily phosphohydrolase